MVDADGLQGFVVVTVVCVSFVEILTMCPTGWFLPTAEGPDYLDQELGAIHEVGELKKDGVLIEG